MLSIRALLSLLIFTLTAAGCGVALHAPSRGLNFELEPAFEINDKDVQDAFAARPQLPDDVRVAFFTFDDARATEYQEMVAALPTVSEVKDLPSLLVTGRRRFHETSRWAPAQPFSIKKLRLLAAKHRCDLLIVFDNGYRHETSANGWASLNILLLPVLFVPFLDTETESYLDAYVIDTRNGYVYERFEMSVKDAEDNLLIWSDNRDEVTEKQWVQLRDGINAQLTTLLEDPSLRLSTPEAK